MELKIYSPNDNDVFMKAIEWNNEEIKEELKLKLEEYRGLVYTDDQIPQAKSDKARLNKLVEALENKRKEIKKQCLDPYEKFERQVKELVALINEPILLIDKQIKEFEDEKKKRKFEEIQAYFNEVNNTDFLKFEQIYSAKWLNVSVSFNNIKKEINARIEEIQDALKVLDSLPNYSFEAKDMYKNTLNMEMAIREANRLGELAKRKEEEEKKKEEEPAKEDIKGISNVSEYMNPPQSNPPEDAAEERQWIGFEAYLSKQEAKELKEFFDRRGISIRRPIK